MKIIAKLIVLIMAGTIIVLSIELKKSWDAQLELGKQIMENKK